MFYYYHSMTKDAYRLPKSDQRKHAEAVTHQNNRKLLSVASPSFAKLQVELHRLLAPVLRLHAHIRQLNSCSDSRYDNCSHGRRTDRSGNHRLTLRRRNSSNVVVLA
jgi:hypothetical protein